jgi:osmotically-inducible protein OsmY
MGIPDSLSPRLPSRLGALEKAEARLRSNSYLALKNVSCELEHGVLTLRGCVPSYYLREMATSAVSRLDGIDTVVNELQVIASPRR